MEVPEQFHFESERRVEFADTDMAGIVHFANFFRFVESTEHAFFRALGWSVHSAQGDKHTGWPRISASCEFYRPARYQDILKIGLRIEEIGQCTFRYRFFVFGPGGADAPPIASGRFTTLYVELNRGTGEMRKCPIPPELRKLLENAL